MSLKLEGIVTEYPHLGVFSDLSSLEIKSNPQGKDRNSDETLWLYVMKVFNIQGKTYLKTLD